MESLLKYKCYEQTKSIPNFILLCIIDLPQGIDLQRLGRFGQDPIPLADGQISFGRNRRNVHQDQGGQRQQCVARDRHRHWDDQGRSRQESWNDCKIWNERVLIKTSGLLRLWWCTWLKCLVKNVCFCRKSSVKVDSSETWTSHLRDSGPPLYLLSYRANRDWRRVFPYQVHEIFSRRLERYPSEDVQCFDSVTKASSEKHEEKI